ncbi:histidinol-phosphatase [Pseudomonas sp. NPDC007930]|uniref:histidinol-phosphatase n=1 Tax=Pseudomonas sp. NPDC007930 TaxID=3364417 RepID=UPI0036E76D1B
MPATPLPLAELRAFAETLAQAAADAALPHFRTRHAVENKLEHGFDPVTLADQGAEQAMRELIHAQYPEHGIFGEEYGQEPGTSPLTWVLDPIDGTRAFITGLPLWGTLIALNDGQAPVLGMMSQPFTGERFVGTPEGAWLGEQRLRTRACARFEDAVLMSTSPQLFDIPSRKAVFERLAGQARMTRYGGDCYAYCMLAMGLVDVVIEDNLKPYDVQALIPIIEGAGGRMTAWDGGTAQKGGAVVAAGDPALHAWLLTQLRPAL